jgi:hypothetical protein
MLHTTAELVSADAPAETVTERVAGELKALLGLRECTYQPGALIGHHPLLQADGHVEWDGARWDIEHYGLPRDPIELRVRSNGDYRGRFLLTGEPGTAPSLEARLVAVVLAEQAGASLARHGHPAPGE